MRPDPCRLALAEQEEPAEIEALGEPGQPGGAHDRGATRGQDALVVLGIAGVQGIGDGEVHDGVAQELESFVVALGLTGVLVQPGGVGQRLGQETPIPDRQAELLGEEVRPVHDPECARRAGGPGTALGVSLVDVFDGVADGSDPLRVLVGDLRPELLLEAHDQLDEVEGVGVQVVDERRLGLDFFFVDAELLDDDLLEPVVGAGH